jgi:helix-turn-helix protein
MGKRKPEMLTVKEVAQRLSAAPSTVRAWLKEGLFPGARLITDSIVPYWLIPDTEVTAFDKPKPGRPRKPLSELKSKPRRKD